MSALSRPHGGGGVDDEGGANNNNKDEEASCPVCLEPLSLRLHGERGPLDPVCSHKLHESCFEAVYGPVKLAVNPRTAHRVKGVCGVCRRDMRLGEDPYDHTGGAAKASSAFFERESRLARSALGRRTRADQHLISRLHRVRTHGRHHPFCACVDALAPSAFLPPTQDELRL